MNNDALTLILAALAAFFTLITGAAAIFATGAVLYFKKLKNEREEEIKKLGELQDALSRKINEAEGIREGSHAQIEEIKRDYRDLRNRFFHIAAPQGFAGGGGGGYGYAGSDYSGSVTIKDLQAQIQALMAQLSALQENK